MENLKITISRVRTTKDFIVIAEIFVSVTVCKRKRKKNRKQSGRKASAIPAWRSERFITADSVISTSFPRVEFSSFEKRILSYVNLYTSVGIIRQSQYRREWPLEKRWNATVTIHPFPGRTPTVPSSFTSMRVPTIVSHAITRSVFWYKPRAKRSSEIGNDSKKILF